MDDGFGLNRFDGGAPGGGPGGSIDARCRFFDARLLGIASGTNFFGTHNWGFGFGLMRFELGFVRAELSLCMLLLLKFELPSFQNGFQFNCHFGLRLDFELDTLHYPLQH